MSKKEEYTVPTLPAMPPGMPTLPKEAQKRLEEIKVKIEEFQKEILKKFDEYVVGIALLPPPQPAQGTQPTKEELDKIHILVLVDDTDSQKMSKFELKDKLIQIIDETAKKVDPNLTPNTVLLSELWQSCYDSKYDLLQLIAMSAPVYDKGTISAVKIGEIHKSMVLKKFEKYIVSYVLFGSVARGQATTESDIDVAIIIDDTDVKKMTRAELKDKLRAIIVSMGLEAGDMTGIRNKLNIQPYILTEFWDNIKEANPVIFTVLRDGIPFYDRGMFMPWKQLLRMGRIKPSRESIDMFMSSGEQMIPRVKARLKELIEVEIYWSALTPTQAALMMYGVPPPTPGETIRMLEEIFVVKEKLLEKKYVDTMKTIREYYKGFETGKIKEVSGKEVDDLLKRAEEYLKRIKQLFGEIELLKDREDLLNVYDHIVTMVRDILALDGAYDVDEKDLVKQLDTLVVSKGKMQTRYLRLFQDLVKARKDYETKKFNQVELENIKKIARELTRHLIEYIQRKRSHELERARIKVRYGEKEGELYILGELVYITPDLAADERKVQKASYKHDGTIGIISDTTLEDFEQAITKAKIPPHVFIKENFFENLKKIFGKDVEILVNRIV